MRSLLLATALACAALIPAATRPADACGGYGAWTPVIYPIATHAVTGGTTAAFVVLENRLADSQLADHTWTQLDANPTYDRSATAPADDVATSIQVTLVGPKSARVVEATHAVWLREHHQPYARLAFEVPTGDYLVALVGNQPDARWQHLTAIHGSTVSTYSADGIQLVTNYGTRTTRWGTATLDGTPLGLVTYAKRRYLVWRRTDGTVAMTRA